MPQMMPINWLISFFFFIMLFIIFNIMNYYMLNLNYDNKKINMNKMIKNINWKW
uniref:ATP synthase complex subunit 8 n=1 Tax=Idaea effusaria TaxID=2249568 RepID=A0A6B9N145_9NEOP|nr:ATP synthase F0 subunit 8 [Idaea effusaria]